MGPSVGGSKWSDTMIYDTHRHVSKKVSAVHSRFPHEGFLLGVKLLRDGSQVVGGEVRALQQAVQGVHAAQHANLFLMIQPHDGR